MHPQKIRTIEDQTTKRVPKQRRILDTVHLCTFGRIQCIGDEIANIFRPRRYPGAASR